MAIRYFVIVVAGLSLYPSYDAILITLFYCYVGVMFLWARAKAKQIRQSKLEP